MMTDFSIERWHAQGIKIQFLFLDTHKYKLKYIIKYAYLQVRSSGVFKLQSMVEGEPY